MHVTEWVAVSEIRKKDIWEWSFVWEQLPKIETRVQRGQHLGGSPRTEKPPWYYLDGSRWRIALGCQREFLLGLQLTSTKGLVAVEWCERLLATLHQQGERRWPCLKGCHSHTVEGRQQGSCVHRRSQAGVWGSSTAESRSWNISFPLLCFQ